MSPTPAPRNPPNSANPAYQPGLFTPIIESVDQAVRGTSGEPGLLELPRPLTTEDFARAVTVATVSALRHQQAHPMPPMSPARGIHRTNTAHHEHDPSGGHGEGGHGGPSWSRTTSTSVLLTCTVLYAAIAGLSPFLFFAAE
jgi:Ca2+:H+ antiporter